MTSQCDYEIFEAGDVTLQSGAVFPAMKLAYKTYGTLSSAKDNVILYPTSFSAQHFDTEWLIGPDGVLDLARYFIIIPTCSATACRPRRRTRPCRSRNSPITTPSRSNTGCSP